MIIVYSFHPLTLIIPVHLDQACEILRSVCLETGLIDVHETVGRSALGPAPSDRIFTPLAQAGHLPWQFEFLAALSLDDPDRAVGGLHEEVGNVVREIAVGLHVINFETDGEVVLGEGDDIRRGVEKAREG